MDHDGPGGHPSMKPGRTPSAWAPLSPTKDVIRDDFPPWSTGSVSENRYHIQIRKESAFSKIRLEDLDDRGHVQRIAGQRGGEWDTIALLIHQEDAHVEQERLVGDSPPARDALSRLGTSAIRTRGNRFVADPGRPGFDERPRPRAGWLDRLRGTAPQTARAPRP